MNTFRVVFIASIAAVAAACSSTASKPDAAPKVAAAPADANIAGSWTVSTETPMGPSDSKMNVVQTGKDIKGTLESPMGSVAYTGMIVGNDVKFGFDFDAQGTSLRIDYSGVLENGAMKGKVVLGSFGEGTWTAKKNP